MWENDPCWTCWVTKTVLIATVFGSGTASLGMGAGRGAALTAVHTIVLTLHHWSLWLVVLLGLLAAARAGVAGSGGRRGGEPISEAMGEPVSEPLSRGGPGSMPA